jgi:hypothetical protein
LGLRPRLAVYLPLLARSSNPGSEDIECGSSAPSAPYLMTTWADSFSSRISLPDKSDTSTRECSYSIFLQIERILHATEFVHPTAALTDVVERFRAGAG